MNHSDLKVRQYNPGERLRSQIESKSSGSVRPIGCRLQEAVTYLDQSHGVCGSAGLTALCRLVGPTQLRLQHTENCVEVAQVNTANGNTDILKSL